MVGLSCNKCCESVKSKPHEIDRCTLSNHIKKNDSEVISFSIHMEISVGSVREQGKAVVLR